MTRGKERELPRVPSLGTDFKLYYKGNAKPYYRTYKYIDPNDSVDFNKIEIFIRNNFAIFNAYVFDKDNNCLTINRRLAEEIAEFTPLNEQLNLLIQQGIEFYRDTNLGEDVNKWLIKVGTPILKSQTKVELDTLYMTIQSNRLLRPQLDVSAKPEEQFINILNTDKPYIYTPKNAFHPHINTSGHPCLGGYQARLNDYAVHGSLVGYFGTLKQWANTNNSRDAYWNLPRLIRRVSGPYMKLKKKSGKGYMLRKITYILPIKILIKMRDAWNRPVNNSSYFTGLQEYVGHSNIDVNAFREITQYYIDKYNKNPKEFKYNENEILERTRAYSILFTCIQVSLFKGVQIQGVMKAQTRTLRDKYFRNNRSSREDMFGDVLDGIHTVHGVTNNLKGHATYKHLKSNIHSFSQMINALLSTINHNKGSLENTKSFYEMLNGVMEYGWFKYMHKFIGDPNDQNYQFIEDLQLYTKYHNAAQQLHLEDPYQDKILNYTDLYLIKDWMSLGAIKDFYKHFSSYKSNTARTKLLKKIVEEILPSIHSFSEYEDILLNKYWDIDVRLGYQRKRTWQGPNAHKGKWVDTPKILTPIEKVQQQEKKMRRYTQLKHITNIKEMYNDFNSLSDYKIIKEEDITEFSKHIEELILDMLYEWTANMVNKHAKELNHAIETRNENKIKKNKETDKAEYEERLTHIPEDVRESSVSTQAV